jgi:CheY-like chemotaxis protein
MNKKTILLVEDNPDDVELTKLALKNEAIDCNLMVMSDGVEVIDHFSTTDKQLKGVAVIVSKLAKMV